MIVAIAAPIFIIALTILWIMYATIPAMVLSLSSKKAAPPKSSAAIARAKNPILRSIAIVAIVVTIIVVLLLLWFCVTGGPSSGDHIFGGSDKYLDMQVGVGCIAAGALLATTNYIARNLEV